MNIKNQLTKLKTRLLRKKEEIPVSISSAKDITAEERKWVKDIKEMHEEKLPTIGNMMAANSGNLKNILLDSKVDEYIKWNYKNMVKGQYTDIGEYWKPIELKNFIEKMAVWYELRYPSYEVNRLMPGSGQEITAINNVMFNDNNYINGLLDKNSDIRSLDWDEFYNTHAFIKSLPWEERYRFKRPKYIELVYVEPNYAKYDLDVKRKTAHLHLTTNGFVKEAEDFDIYTDFKITNEQLNGMHVKDVVKLLKENNIELPKDNELESAISSVENWIKQKEGLLDAVMYRIIERGGNRIGPRRGFIFAKEFGRNIDIPMMYGVDKSDPGLRLFVNEYIKAGGSKDLICYNDYFSRTNKTKNIDTISIKDLILTQNNNAATFYTPEETELHQRFVDAIDSQINHDEVRKEEVKQLRLQRRKERR